MSFQIKKVFYLFLILLIFPSFSIFSSIKANTNNLKSKKFKTTLEKSKKSTTRKSESNNIDWRKIYDSKEKKRKIWSILKKDFSLEDYIKSNNIREKKYVHKVSLHSLNRSIIFSDKIIGPDISWLVPPGLKWNNRYRFDSSIRGHNRRVKGESFFKWNGGDAVGQFYYQALVKDKYSIGLNLGMRSVYTGSAIGGQTNIGEGLSAGFRVDKKLSDNSGIAFGAEQLLHFDGLTDTGRDIYITATKAWWRGNLEGNFPLNIATAGFGTGKLAEGNIKGLCSDLLGGSGTETLAKRKLCWAPIFTLSRVHNNKLSTFFEHNSKWFLIGTSISPSDKIPIRGTFAVILSDHIDNYKLKNFDELKWVFRINLGF